MIDWIKDRFYNKNDLLVAFLIIVAAGFLIWTRIDVVMSYSDTLTAEQPGTNEQQNVAVPETIQNDITDKNDSSQDGEDVVMPDSFTITVPPGSSAEDIAKILVDNSVIRTEQVFLSAVSKLDAAEKLKADTFVIPAGTSPEGLVEIMSK